MIQKKCRLVLFLSLMGFFVSWLLLGAGCSTPKEGCEVDTDCKAPTLFCVEKKCQSCRKDEDCGRSQRCSSGACSDAPKEAAPEPAPKEKQSEQVTAPDEPSVAPEDAGVGKQEETPEVRSEPEPERTAEAAKEAIPEQPKVVRPPVLPKSVGGCGSSKNCCIPASPRVPVQEHTPRSTPRSLWSTAAWSKDQKWMAYASGVSPVIFLRKGTAPGDTYSMHRTLQGAHTQGIFTLAFSNDGNYLASAGYDRRVVVWRLSDGKEVYRFTGPGSTVYKLVFSPDSSLLLSADSYGRKVHIWRMKDGKLQLRALMPNTVWSVAVSPDNQFFATAHDNTNIMLWNLSTGKSVRTMPDHSRRVRSVAFSPDGKRLISGSDDNRLMVWDLSTGKPIRSYPCGGDVFAVEYSPDGQTIAGACTDRTARIWDANGTAEKQRFTHLALVSSVQWSRDSKYLLTSGYDQHARVWDVAKGTNVRNIFFDKKIRALAAYDRAGQTLAYVAAGSKDILLMRLSDSKLLYTLKGHTSHITDIHTSADGRYLVTGASDNTAKVWRWSDGKLVYDLKKHKASVLSVKVDPTSKWVATGSEDNTVNIWRLSDGKPVKELKGTNDVRALAWNSDGRYIAAAFGATVQVINASTGSVFRTLRDSTGPVDAIDWSYKASRLALAGWDRKIYVYNAINWSLINSWTAHSYAITSLEFDADGKHVFSVALDNTLRVYEPDSLDRKHLFYGHSLGITHMWRGPKKGLLSTASWDGTIRHWSIEDTPRVIQAGDKVVSVSVSKDNMWVAGGLENGTVGVWRLSDGKKMGDFEAHEDVVRSVVFSPSGDLLVSTSDDQMVKVWDMRKGKLLYTLKGHIDRVYKAIFTADEKTIVTVSRDTSVRLWDVATGKLSKKVTGARGALLDVALSPDGRYLAVASFSGLVYVWETKDYSKLYATLRGHLGGALSVQFRSNDDLLSGSLDSRIRYWRMRDKRALRNIVGHNGPVLGLASRPGSTYFATASEDKTIRSWRKSDGLLLHTGEGHSGPVNSIDAAGDGRWVTGSTDATIRIWGSLLLRLRNVKTLQPFGVTAAKVSRDGTLVISTGYDRRTRLRRISDNSLRRTFYGSSKTVRSVDISGDNAVVAFGDDDTYVRVYSASNGAYLFVGKHASSVTATMFSHDNKSIVTGTEKGVVKVWSVASKKLLKELSGHVGKVHTLSRSTDGKVWLSASTQGPIQLWQTSDDKKLRSWPKQSMDITSADLSGAGDKVVASIGTNKIKLWQVKDGKELKTITAPAEILRVRFGGGGAWIAASLKDSTVVLWSLQSFQVIATLKQGHLPLYGLDVLSSGKTLTAGDENGFLYLWTCQ